MVADVHDIALVLSTVIPAVGAFVLGLLVLRRQRVHGVAIDQINTAVNHRPATEPTLVTRVANLELAIDRHVEWEHANSEWVSRSLILIAHHVGATLPAPPPEGVQP